MRIAVCLLSLTFLVACGPPKPKTPALTPEQASSLLHYNSRAEAWKTATALPGISFAELTPPQKNLVLKILREHDCSCNCGMKLAECRIADPACAYSNGLATEIIKAVQGGKSEKDAWAVATQS